jgi:hypothetical protein
MKIQHPDQLYSGSGRREEAVTRQDGLPFAGSGENSENQPHPRSG